MGFIHLDILVTLDSSSSFSQAIMKSYVVNSSDPSKPEKFLAYMVPAPDEVIRFLFVIFQVSLHFISRAGGYFQYKISASCM